MNSFGKLMNYHFVVNSFACDTELLQQSFSHKSPDPFLLKLDFEIGVGFDTLRINTQPATPLTVLPMTHFNLTINFHPIM